MNWHVIFISDPVEHNFMLHIHAKCKYGFSHFGFGAFHSVLHFMHVFGEHAHVVTCVWNNVHNT